MHARPMGPEPRGSPNKLRSSPVLGDRSTAVRIYNCTCDDPPHAPLFSVFIDAYGQLAFAGWLTDHKRELAGSGPSSYRAVVVAEAETRFGISSAKVLIPRFREDRHRPHRIPLSSFAFEVRQNRVAQAHGERRNSIRRACAVSRACGSRSRPSKHERRRRVLEGRIAA